MTQYQIEAKIYLFSPKNFFSLMILLPNFFHDLSIPRCISYNTNQTTKIAWQIWCTVLLVSQSIVSPSPVTPVERLGIWKDIWWKKRQHDVPMSIKWKKSEYSYQSGILMHCPTLTSVCAILLIGITTIGMMYVCILPMVLVLYHVTYQALELSFQRF